MLLLPLPSTALPNRPGKALSWGHISLHSLQPQPGRDRSTWSWKEETPAEYINISYFILFKSWRPPGGKGQQSPQPTQLLERNSVVVSKVQVLPGQGTCPPARGGREISTSPCRCGPSSCSGQGGPGRVGSLCILNSNQRVGCAASPPAQGCVRGTPWGQGPAKRCSVRQCAATASCRRG